MRGYENPVDMYILGKIISVLIYWRFTWQISHLKFEPVSCWSVKHYILHFALSLPGAWFEFGKLLIWLICNMCREPTKNIFDLRNELKKETCQLRCVFPKELPSETAVRQVQISSPNSWNLSNLMAVWCLVKKRRRLSLLTETSIIAPFFFFF